MTDGISLYYEELKVIEKMLSKNNNVVLGIGLIRVLNGCKKDRS